MQSLEEKPVVLHHGVYKPIATMSEAIFLVVGLTIGAGILGLPYAINKVGLAVGLFYILVLGIVTLILHLTLSEVALRTGEPMQLPGFAGRYLGRFAKAMITLIIIVRSYGVLLAYLVGAGAVLAVLLGGSTDVWTLAFWTVFSFMVWQGLRRIKKINRVISIAVLLLIVGLSLYLFPQGNFNQVAWVVGGDPLFPIGIILFALSGAHSIAEVHAILPGSERHFRKAITIGTLIPMAVYMLFVVAVIGVLGNGTTEVATVGLVNKFGPAVMIVANLFALLAMSSAFVGVGSALKDSLIWDHKFSPTVAILAVVSVPLLLFYAGARGFVSILEVIGGVFMALEGIVMILIYYAARKTGDLIPSRFGFTSGPILAGVVMVFFALVFVYSTYNLFLNWWGSIL